MRIEELTDSRYYKETDNVEKYLLRLIDDYFKTVNYTAPSSREYIIEQAVRRLKEEVDFDSLGVLSISLPDDENPRTGAVNISIADLHGEPEILDKKSAFNVPFGELQNTACEGNDERLSNAREPLPHTHTVDDIPGLAGIVNTLNEKAQRLEDNRHSHSNKSVLDLLTYSGSKNSIDLAILDNLDTDMTDLVADVIQEIEGYKTSADNKIAIINTKIEDIKTRINTLNATIVSQNETYLNTSKDYTDQKMQEILDSIDNILALCVTKQDFKNILAMITDTYVFAGEDSINIQEFFDIYQFGLLGGATYQQNNTYSFAMNSDILDFIEDNDQELRDCIFEPYVEYQGFYQQLPISFEKNLLEDGFITMDFDLDSKRVIINICSRLLELPSYLNNCSLKYKVFCKPKIEYDIDDEEEEEETEEP